MHSKIVLNEALNLANGLEDLSDFSHIWVIAVFHDNQNDRVHTKIHPPRLSGRSVGVFASRSPHRPNPLSLSVARIESVNPQSGEIEVSGLDLLDRTPVLDLKPYVQEDRIEGARYGWTENLPSHLLDAQLSPLATQQIESIFGPASQAASRAVLELLRLDPRPLHYRQKAGVQNPYTAIYGFRYGDWNVVFSVSNQLATVSHLEPWSEFRARRRE